MEMLSVKTDQGIKSWPCFFQKKGLAVTGEPSKRPQGYTASTYNITQIGSGLKVNPRPFSKLADAKKRVMLLLELQNWEVTVEQLMIDLKAAPDRSKTIQKIASTFEQV